MNKEIIFVYNANSDWFSMLTDYVHKNLSPSTYQCNLCKLTYSATMHKDWKKFIESLPYEVSFLHKNELEKEFPEYKDVDLPVMFKKVDDNLEIAVSAEEISKPETLDELIVLVKGKLKV